MIGFTIHIKEDSIIPKVLNSFPLSSSSSKKVSTYLLQQYLILCL